jgi:hypothetical protein
MHLLCLLCLAAFDRCLLTKLEEIIEKLNELQKSNAALSAKVDFYARASGVAGCTAEIPDDVQFPLNSADEVLSLDHRLRDQQLKNLLVLFDLSSSRTFLHSFCIHFTILVNL